VSKKDERDYKFRGGWGMVNFLGNFGIVRKGFGREKTTYQSMRDREFKSFADARTTAGLEDMGSDQYTHTPVQRAYLRKKRPAARRRRVGR
jgi:hypothetical protein